jgi:hypothetical protein
MSESAAFRRSARTFALIPRFSSRTGWGGPLKTEKESIMDLKRHLRTVASGMGIGLWVLLWALPAAVGGEGGLSSGAAVYVPAYSNIYVGSQPLHFDLAAMLSVRNTDPGKVIVVHAIDYHNSEGKKIRAFLKEQVELKPLASTYVVVGESDTTGGPGASFIVRWRSQQKVNGPIIEAILTGTRSGQGISFICPGKVITEN